MGFLCHPTSLVKPTPVQSNRILVSKGQTQVYVCISALLLQRIRETRTSYRQDGVTGGVQGWATGTGPCSVSFFMPTLWGCVLRPSAAHLLQHVACHGLVAGNLHTSLTAVGGQMPQGGLVSWSERCPYSCHFGVGFLLSALCSLRKLPCASPLVAGLLLASLLCSCRAPEGISVSTCISFFCWLA